MVLNSVDEGSSSRLSLLNSNYSGFKRQLILSLLNSEVEGSNYCFFLSLFEAKDKWIKNAAAK